MNKVMNLSRVPMAAHGKMLVPNSDLNLAFILPSGQSFRWRKIDEGLGSKWIGVFSHHVWILHQCDDFLHYTVYPNSGNIISPESDNGTQKADSHFNEKGKQVFRRLEKEESKSTYRGQKSRKNAKIAKEEKISRYSAHCKQTDTQLYEHMLRDYFQLNVSLSELYNHWSKKDVHFKKIASIFTGIRQLRQDPVENLFSFICSSNNNIARISKMVESLCSEYGEKIAHVDDVTYYDFPSIDALAGKRVEAKLRELGFGYRAKYISSTAQIIQKHGGETWLHDLRTQPYSVAREQLLTLSGVGPKVADCVCLMSLDKTESIPIDTHVIQVAKRDYGFKCDTKSVTEKTYQEIGKNFRELWGEYSGWAQSVLFSADLKMHQEEKSGSKSNAKAPKRKQQNKTMHVDDKPKKAKTSKR